MSSLLLPRASAAHRGGAFAIAAVLCLAPAFGGPLSAGNDPTQPGAVVPPLHYTSPLRSSPAASPASDTAWRDANDLSGRIGGWRAYLREAQGTGAAAAAPAAASAPPSRPHRH
ncbi:MAG: hypothetical protein V4792_02825 [Pseudomonadota bacterium]